MDFLESPIDSKDSTPVNLSHFPKTVALEPPPLAKPILSDGYELPTCLIQMVQNQTFLGKEDENPHTHLNEFEQTCMLGILNAHRKIRKRTDTNVAFTREYSKVSIFHEEHKVY